MNKRVFNGTLILYSILLGIAYVAEIVLTVAFVRDRALVSICIETLLFVGLAIIAVFFVKKNVKRIIDDITDSIDSIVYDTENDGEIYPELEPLLDHLAMRTSEFEESTEKLRAEFERQDKMRREFTANVSHELKTPLTSISGFAEIIRDGMVKEDDISRFAGNIYTEAQRLIVLVGDIIKLSQLDEAVSIVKEETDLYEACEAAISHLVSVAEDCGVEIALEGIHVHVMGADQVLDEMIYNLCDNAIKYNRRGGKVQVKIYERGRCPVVSVKDTGIGIPPEDVDRVFQRFYRVNKSHSKEIGGTGLGLAIVKHGALFHDATLEIESELDKGTEIRIVFPENNDG